MPLLSIDVGIKNLAYCLLDEHTIYKWGVVNLIEDKKYICCVETKTGVCKNEAKFTKNSKYYCLKHAKKEDFIVPNSEINPSTIRKLDIIKLKALADKYSVDHDTKIKKKDLLQEVLDFFKNKCFDSVIPTNASDVDLITIGRSLKKHFNQLFSEEIKIDKVVIENQISPIANRMKTLQGMISQYFIMRNDDILIEFVSASNKLKDFDIFSGGGIDPGIEDGKQEKTNEVTTYNQRKKMGIEKCSQLIKDNNYTEWYQFFLNNKKKDDLSDAFLQGIWFIHQNKC